MMMKRCIALVLFGLLLIGSAYAQDVWPSQPATDTAALADTGYQITLPEGFQTATQPNWQRAVVDATSADGALRILAFVNKQAGWTLDDWQAALTKGSRTNSVTDIDRLTVGDRQWITYRLTIGQANLFDAATAIGDGLFVTLEFRTNGNDQPEAAFPAGAIEACLASLTAAPSTCGTSAASRLDPDIL